MRGSVKATREVDLCLTEPLLKDTGGRACKRKHRNMLKSVTNAKDLHQTFTNREQSSVLFPALGHLLNGIWILQVLSLRQQEIRCICWSAQTISPSGLKPSHQQISQIWMLRNLFGKTSSLDLRSLIPSSRTRF